MYSEIVKNKRPVVETIEVFNTSYQNNKIDIVANLPGYAKTDVDVFFQDERLYIKVKEGTVYTYSIECSSAIYNWQDILTNFYEGKLNITIYKHPQKSNKIKVNL